MTLSLKDRLRRRLLGRRFQRQLFDDHNALINLGNMDYLAGGKELLAPGFVAPINAFEFSVYSQNGEDGVILSLLRKTGVETYYVVEIGTEDGRECNSANLILNFGWRGCLIEANRDSARSARSYFSGTLDSNRDRVVLINETVTPENINQLLGNAGVPANADVLSIDIDSYEYWVWKAVDCIKPGLVVIEYNASFGPERSVTIPYGALENPENMGIEFYHGASLSALQRLGDQKGYILVGCESKGVNAFFVRCDLAARAGLVPVTPQQAFRPHAGRVSAYTQEGQSRRLDAAVLDEV